MAYKAYKRELKSLREDIKVVRELFDAARRAPCTACGKDFATDEELDNQLMDECLRDCCHTFYHAECLPEKERWDFDEEGSRVVEHRETRNCYKCQKDTEQFTNDYEGSRLIVWHCVEDGCNYTYRQSKPEEGIDRSK